LTDQPIERLQTIYEALPEEARRALDSPIAKALNSRLSSLAKRPISFKMKALRSFLIKQRDESLAQEILRSYFLGPRKELVTAFLDATGVAHEDGQVEDAEAQPDGKKIQGAVEALLADQSAEDVALYLDVATFQWPDLKELVEAREQLGSSA
jgi:hypothetical protein